MELVQTRIQWVGIISDKFSMQWCQTRWNLISFLFGVFFDELSLLLRSERIGCRLGHMIVNHLLFADDAVVFAPSAKSQLLLDICSDFAISHNVVFNATKSQCLITKSKHDLIGCPVFHLRGAPLPYTESYKYLD